MLVDDHAVVRTGFRLLLQAAGDIEVTAKPTAAPGRWPSSRHASSRCLFNWRVASRSRRYPRRSNSTIGTHFYNFKQKLGLVNQAEMTLLAVRMA